MTTVRLEHNPIELLCLKQPFLLVTGDSFLKWLQWTE
jgi:hypothetical protein